MASKKRTSPAKGRKGAKSSKRAQPARNAATEMLGFGVLCVALVSLVVLISTDDPSNAVRSLIEGLSGCFSYVLPLIVLWVGILLAFSGSRKHNPGRIIMIASCILFVFGLVHLFSAETIMSQMQLGGGYLNFIEQSFFTRAGTGAIGALLAYPIYVTVGKWAGMILFIFLILANIIMLKQISLRQVGERAHDYFQTGYNDFRQHQSERAMERAQRRQDLEEERLARKQSKWSSWDDLTFDELTAEDVDHAKPANVNERIPPLPRRSDKLEVPEYLKSDRRKAKRVLGEAEPSPESAVDSQPSEQEPSPFHHTRRSCLVEEAPTSSSDASMEAKVDMSPEDDPISAEDEDQFSAPWEQTADDETASPDEQQGEWQDTPEEEAPFDLYNDTDEGSNADEDLTTEDSEPIAFPPLDLSEPTLRERRRKVLGEPAEPAASASSEPNPTRPDHTPIVTPDSSKDTESVASNEYNYPPVDLLALPKPVEDVNRESSDHEKALKLEETLKSFGINAKLTGIAHGPAVTRFELAPAPGVKVSRITSLADDIALNLAAMSVRIEAPIPGKAAVGVEIPNDVIETVPLREVLESAEARKHPSRLAVAMGKDNGGRYIVGDIAKMPHVLIAGATGSGKSVCINCIICSILYRATPEEVRLIMIDPKVVELSIYNGIPHLLVPVVTDPKKAAGALHWAVVEMTERYKKFAERGVRDMKGYNLSCGPDDTPMPQIVIIIDELADLMMVTPGEVEDSICRLAQLARAAGIHLVIATQRPSVNVITGVIKANIPARIAFTVASYVDSRTILDVGGAEKLLGRGDMLFAPSGSNKMQRVQGAWVSDEEVHAIVEYIKIRHDVEYDEDIMQHMNNADSSTDVEEETSDECDELLQQAVEIAVEAGQASISMLQRRLRIGYARAGRLIDEMAARGIISQSEGAKPRNLLITREQYRAMFAVNDSE